MNGLIGFLSGSINFIIIAFGIVLLVFMIQNWSNLRSHYDQIQAAMNFNSRKSMLNKKTMEVVDRVEEEPVTPDTIREFETAFQKSCSTHELLSQLIPVFPLLGIFGTVIGLIGGLGGDLQVLYEGLGTALYSTLFGLIFAIGLKIFDAMGPSKAIYDTEIVLEDYEKKLNNAIRQGHFSEE